MKRRKSDIERARLIDEGIRITFSSLESHLHWTHHKDSDGMGFHRVTVSEYARLMHILSQLY